ncbi:MAG: hypothetical protein IH987_12125, partial [Planctomycetes bacterium]|nr:hypothetical protein [Planctomycetota bacterium]
MNIKIGILVWSMAGAVAGQSFNRDPESADRDARTGPDAYDEPLSRVRGLASDCNDNGIEDEFDLSGGVSEDCNINGIPDECDIAAGVSPDDDDDAVPDECHGEAGVLFVDAAGATPEPDGSSWVKAYRDLQEALDHAENAAGAIHRINVAAGTYYPSKETVPGNPRSASFQLINGVAIYGGYPGCAALNQATQGTLSFGSHERDFLVHLSVLSGDI